MFPGPSPFRFATSRDMMCAHAVRFDPLFLPVPSLVGLSQNHNRVREFRFISASGCRTEVGKPPEATKGIRTITRFNANLIVKRSCSEAYTSVLSWKPECQVGPLLWYSIAQQQHVCSMHTNPGQHAPGAAKCISGSCGYVTSCAPRMQYELYNTLLCSHS